MPEYGDIYVRVRMWYCGDECECSEPVAEIIGPNPLSHVRGINIIRIDEGKFMTDSEQDQEGLIELAKRQGVELDADGVGHRPANEAEIKVYQKYCNYHREWCKKQSKHFEPFVFDGKKELESCR